MRKARIGVAWIGRSVLLAMAKARFKSGDIIGKTYKRLFPCSFVRGTCRPSYTARAVADVLRHNNFNGYLYAKGTALPTSSGSIKVVPCEADRLGIVGVA